MTIFASRPVRVSLVVLAQALLLAGAVYAPLSARLTGTQVRLRVAPVDPIDPFRGAYVRLGYPDFPQADPSVTRVDGQRVYLPLRAQGTYMVAGPLTTTKPGTGPFLACIDRGWQLTCGIESWFVPQDKAKAIETAVRDGKAIAVVRVDREGRAALVGLELP